MRLPVLILVVHQIAHLSVLYLACRAGTTELFYGAWSSVEHKKKLACFIMSCSTDGLVSLCGSLVSLCESWHNWVFYWAMQHSLGYCYFVMLGSCLAQWQ